MIKYRRIPNGGIQMGIFKMGEGINNGNFLQSMSG
jgi:hypothetical protein